MPREIEVCALCSEMGTLVSVAHFPLLASLDSNWNAQSTEWQFLLWGQSRGPHLPAPTPSSPNCPFGGQLSWTFHWSARQGIGQIEWLVNWWLATADYSVWYWAGQEESCKTSGGVKLSQAGVGSGWPGRLSTKTHSADGGPI